MNQPLVTIITATTANRFLPEVIESVQYQTYKNIQHLIFVDGPDHRYTVRKTIPLFADNIDVIELPYAVGVDRFNGHRMYAAGTYLAKGDVVMFLDDDNTLDSNHVESCMNALAGNQWCFSMRKIVDSQGKFICNDDCESLGLWPSVMDEKDYFVDVNCYFLPKPLALHITPLWYRRIREPGQMEVDRVICHVLRQIAPKYVSSGEYSVNYMVGSTNYSVQKDFFLHGNGEMLRRYGDKLPWKKGDVNV